MTTAQESPNVDEEKLNELVGTVVEELGATVYAALAVIGDRLGLYEALADAGPLASTELAERTDTAERYVREWLAAGAAGGYVTYDPETDRYSLSPEQTALFADSDGPAYLMGGFQNAIATVASTPDVEAGFRTGEGVGWHEHEEGVHHGTERFFKPTYRENLVDDWIPALDGVDGTLRDGGRVADVGCGYGASTIIMAEAYPESTVVGFDYHDESIAAARRRASEAGVGDRATFEVATAKEFDGDDYDFVTTFDCYHDMGDPVGIAEHVREALADDGAWMIVEPFAEDSTAGNLTPLGRAFYSWSTMLCTPNSLDQDDGDALGAQAGEARLREVVTDGGFSRFRRATETPFNLILEARP